MTDRDIRNEARLFALESLICQFLGGGIYRLVPREDFQTARKNALERARRETFLGEDAATSELLSTELTAATDRLYRMIEHDLGTVQD